MNLSLKIISFFYALGGLIALIGYLPTIKDLYQKKPSANVNSYIIWTFTTGVGFLYSIVVISDLLLEIVSGMGFLSCAIIMVLAIRLKYSKKGSNIVP